VRGEAPLVGITQVAVVVARFANIGGINDESQRRCAA